MFPIARAAAKRAQAATTSRISSRSFAEVVRAPVPNSLSRRQPQRLSRILKEKVSVREDHGLYGFFRQKENAHELAGEAKYEVVESPQDRQKQTGRSWRASELRLKSFKDLHTLWYILLRERNLLATQKEETRRMGVSDTSMQVSAMRVYHTRKSMARIKAVLNERRLAYEGAIKIVEAERDEKIDQKVQNSMQAEWKQKARHLNKRKAYLTRRLELQAKKAGRGEVTENHAKEGANEPTSPSMDGTASQGEATKGHAKDGANEPTSPSMDEIPESHQVPDSSPVKEPSKPEPIRVGGFLIDK